MPKPNRREALITIAAGAAVQACAGPENAADGPLSAADLEQLGVLVDTIIPATDTPGAGEAGVATMIGEDASGDEKLLAQTRQLLTVFGRKGFFDLDGAGQIEAMTAMMTAGGDEQAAFEDLKSLAIDYYYSTETGLADELGYQGATYLAEFPGCTHDHFTEAV